MSGAQWTALPASGIARISNLVPHAGGISSPKSPVSPVRKIGPHGASPIHPGLVALPGSGAVLESHGCLLPTGNLAAALSPPNSGAAASLISASRAMSLATTLATAW